jgi:hypothetical protein
MTEGLALAGGWLMFLALVGTLVVIILRRSP